MNDKKREILLNLLFDSVKKDLNKKDFERIENAVCSFQKNMNQALLEFKKDCFFFMSLLKKDLCVDDVKVSFKDFFTPRLNELELTDTDKKKLIIALGIAFIEFKSAKE